MKVILVAILSLFSTQTSAATPLVEHILNLCSQTIVEIDSELGKIYSTKKPSISELNGKVATAILVQHEGATKVKLTIFDQGKTAEFFLPEINFKQILLTEESVWFLSNSSITEYNLAKQNFAGKYPSFPKPYNPEVSTFTRGFTYQDGYIYIAHGELGVSIFNTKTKSHFTVIRNGIQPASLAVAAVRKGDSLYILQGAFQPSGFNGVAVVNLKNGSNKLIAYSAASGVVDPYSSTMIVKGETLILNNGGWLHSFPVSAIDSGKSPQTPIWLAVSEKVESSSGTFDQYLMVNGDFVISDSQVLACSYVNYVPKQQRRPIKEWKLIRKTLLF